MKKFASFFALIITTPIWAPVILLLSLGSATIDVSKMIFND